MTGWGQHNYHCEYCERDGWVGWPPNGGCDSVISGQQSVTQIVERLLAERTPAQWVEVYGREIAA